MGMRLRAGQGFGPDPPLYCCGKVPPLTRLLFHPALHSGGLGLEYQKNEGNVSTLYRARMKSRLGGRLGVVLALVMRVCRWRQMGTK